MPWVVKRRWWVLGAGLALYLLGIEPPGADIDLRSIAGGVGVILALLGMLAVVIAIANALRSRRGAPHSPDHTE
jgi:hypothetical protein